MSNAVLGCKFDTHPFVDAVAYEISMDPPLFCHNSCITTKWLSKFGQKSPVESFALDQPMTCYQGDYTVLPPWSRFRLDVWKCWKMNQHIGFNAAASALNLDEGLCAEEPASALPVPWTNLDRSTQMIQTATTA